MNSIKTIGSIHVRIVPDFPRYVREVNRYGVVGATARKMLQLSTGDKLSLIIDYIPHAVALLRKDFVRGVMLLIDMELREEKTSTSGIVLAHQLTDLAACFGNSRLFEGFYRFAQQKHLKSGIATYNPRITIPYIRKHHIPFDYVIISGSNRTHTLQSLQRFGKTAVFRLSQYRK